MSTIFGPHLPFSASSSPKRSFSSPPATPGTSSRARPKYRRGCIMSSPPNIYNRPVFSKTPRTLSLRNTYLTSSTGGSADAATISRHGSQSTNRFSAREIKPNPLVSSRDSQSFEENRATRRILFLNRVKEAGEEKRWRERNVGFAQEDEDFLRALWLAERKRWQEQQRIEAAARDIPEDYEEPDEELQDVKEEAELENFISQERSNSSIYDLLQNASQMDDITPIETHTISENYEDEYDSIFMELIQQENRNFHPSLQHIEIIEDHDLMDMS